jgi:LysR family hydrogen peroxide-inducible transcriptional activator
MTLTQLEYIKALADHGSFVAAAEACFVTQPTLSMQIKKLEDDFGVQIFDRNEQPVRLTPMGELILERAAIILHEAGALKEMVKGERLALSGTLRVGIIPTLAPFLVPLFIGKFLKMHTKVELHLTEFTTEEIIHRLKQNQLDCGILATPLEEANLREFPVFYEAFVGYVSEKNKLFKKNTLVPADLTADETWVLHEGHCFRNQVLNICKFKGGGDHSRLHYESGSIETLKRMVETESGMTILPELAIKGFDKKEMNRVRYFRSPEPVREVSVVTNRYFVKERLLQALREAISNVVPEKMRSKGRNKAVSIQS